MPNQIVCPKCYNHGMAKSGFTDGRQRYLCRECGFRTVHGIEDVDVVTENVRLAKQKQSAQDLNRIEESLLGNTQGLKMLFLNIVRI